MGDRAATVYVTLYAIACVLAAMVFVRERASYALGKPAYLRFVLVPWKLVTFTVATLFFVLIAPLSGDPTWDRIDGLFMSVLTYLSAPWSVGALFLVARGRLPKSQAFVAACVWLFSASWSYDLYLLALHREYPGTWSSNLVASSVLYVCAGLFWNLVHVPGRGVIFAFMGDGWPAPPSGGSQRRVLALALLLGGLVAAMMAPFVWEAYRGLGR